MKIASLADLHLGYTGAGRREGGRPVRQVDVERALGAAVGRIIERQPDLVTIAGDVFDTVTPPLAAVDAFLRAMRHLLERTSATVVMVGGNHETPRTLGVLGPNRLAEQTLRRVIFLEPGESVQGSGWQVHGFGCSYLNRPDAVVPEPEEGVVNVLLIHAAVRSSARPDAVPAIYAGADAFDVARAHGFDVVACGDFHEFRVLAGAAEVTDDGKCHIATGGPLAFYSGSIERTSSNMWAEAAPKGFAFVDTEARTLEFVEVPTRRMADYDMGDFNHPPVNDAAQVNDALAQLLSYDCTADSLVRLKVEMPRSERDGIDWRLVQALKTRCVHFHLDIRYATAETLEFTDRRARGQHSLADDAALFFFADEPSVQRACFDALGVGAPATSQE